MTHTTRIALTLIGMLAAATGLHAGAGDLERAAELIRQGREQGLTYLETQNKKTKKQSGKAARQALAQAEDLARAAAKGSDECSGCEEKRAEAAFYKAYFGFEPYERVLKMTARARERFPESARLALLEGYAHYNGRAWTRAIRPLKEALIFSDGDTETADQAQQVLDAAQEKFLTSWYQHANFYESAASQLNLPEKSFQASQEWELQLGKGAMAKLMGKKVVEVRDPELTGYLENLVNELVAATPDGPPFQYEVSVIDSPQINAVTVPGHVVVYTGLLAFVENEAELVGVLAHELAHNYGHHSSRRYIAKQGAKSLAGSLLSLVKPKKPEKKILAGLAADVSIDLFLKAFDRHEEKEADLYGTHLAFNAGYDPTAVSAFLLKMYGRKPKQKVRFLSTHPPTPRRVEYVTDYLDNFPLEDEKRTDSEEFRRMQTRLFPEAGDAGAVRGHGVLPPID